jgi:hypothetical protein
MWLIFNQLAMVQWAQDCSIEQKHRQIRGGINAFREGGQPSFRDHLLAFFLLLGP